MIERRLVPHDLLVERFRSAAVELSFTAFSDNLLEYIENLHRIERHIFNVDEYETDVPAWA